MNERKIILGSIGVPNSNERIYTLRSVGRETFSQLTTRIGHIDPGLIQELEAAGYIVSEEKELPRQYDFTVEEQPKDYPKTVKGNSRQSLVSGKNHTWPGAKKRKEVK
jgi:hypothetical protein